MTFLGTAVIGFLLGLIFCYWKQLQTLNERKDLIGAAGDFAGAGQNLLDELKKL